MKKLLCQITAIFLAGFFLVSFTGVKMILHHCLSCDTIEHFLVSQVAGCCDQPDTRNTPDNSGSSCCTASNSENGSCGLSDIKNKSAHCDNCCEIEVVYLKYDYEVHSERQVLRVIPSVIAVIPVLISEIQSSVFSNSIISFSESFQPPPKLVGKEFVLYAHQLKVS